MRRKKFFIVVLCMLIIFPTFCYAAGADLGDLNAYGGGSGDSS